MFGKSAVPPGHYWSTSKRKAVPVREMVTEHLDRAIAKKTRERGDAATLQTLKSERDRRSNG